LIRFQFNQSLNLCSDDFSYRYYDQNGIVPLFPFGHGLSYTSFAYDSLQISALSLSFSLSNVGVRAGDEVWQLYIGFPAAANEPPKVLRGFNKVHLEAGGSTTEYWTLTERDLSIWDAEVHGWQRIHGNFSVFIGASSRDVRLHAVFQA
jgi:beta-glucosidase